MGQRLAVEGLEEGSHRVPVQQAVALRAAHALPQLGPKRGYDVEQEFELGLDVLLDGLTVRLAAKLGPARRR